METSKVENKSITPIKKTVTTVKKTEKQIKQEVVAKFVAKNNKMIRGEFLTYGLKGVREMDLTWKIDKGNVFKKHVKHGDRLSLPFGYVKYLNDHGTVRKTANTGLRLEDSYGLKIKVSAQSPEIKYEFRILDILSSEEMAELTPSVIVRATKELW